MDKGRWNVAQFHEKRFWERFRNSKADKECSTSITDYWTMHYKKLADFVSIRRDTACLEIGCGPTPFLERFPECSKYAIDPLMDYYVSSFSMPDKIRYIKGIGENLPFHGENFDILISINALDHVFNPGKFIKETIRCLKNGGTLYLVVDCYPSLVKYYKSIKEKLKIGNSKLHPNSFTVKDVIKLIEDSNVEISHISAGVGTLGDHISISKHKVKEIGKSKSNSKINYFIDILQKKGFVKFVDVMINKILYKLEKKFSDNAANSDFIFIVSKL